MKRSENNLTTSFERKLKTSAVVALSLALSVGSAAYAQSVNDDLKPKSTAPKAAVSKPKPKPGVKTSSKTTTKKAVQSKQNSRKKNTGKGNSVKKIDDNQITSETPDQILNRFMSFQQSAGVTDRDWKSVLAQTTKTLETNPNNTVAKAQSLIAQGQLAYNQGNYAMATIHFKSVLQILPQSSLPQYSLGRTYLANGQAEAAEKAFKQAIEQNEKFALAYKGMGDALAAQGEKKKATKYFQKATEISIKSGNMPL